jgi:predicted nucleic acid-binding protein
MIVLDTTVLVYAKGADHPLREPCRALLEAVGRGALAATTTAEVIQEFAHVRARRRDRSDAAELAAAYLDLLSPLLPVGEEQVLEGLRLFERHPELGCFDAVLAAAAMAAGAEALVSADGAFASVPGLVHVHPGTPALAALLER